MKGEQLPLWDSTTRTRHGDPETSHDAAASLSPHYIRASQRAVLAFLREFGPMTDHALVHQYDMLRIPPAQSESGLRTRRSELTDAGLVHDTGKRVRLRSGRKAIVWGAYDDEG